MEKAEERRTAILAGAEASKALAMQRETIPNFKGDLTRGEIHPPFGMQGQPGTPKITLAGPL